MLVMRISRPLVPGTQRYKSTCTSDGKRSSRRASAARSTSASTCSNSRAEKTRSTFMLPTNATATGLQDAGIRRNPSADEGEGKKGKSTVLSIAATSVMVYREDEDTAWMAAELLVSISAIYHRPILFVAVLCRCWRGEPGRWARSAGGEGGRGGCDAASPGKQLYGIRSVLLVRMGFTPGRCRSECLAQPGRSSSREWAESTSSPGRRLASASALASAEIGTRQADGAHHGFYMAPCGRGPAVSEG